MPESLRWLLVNGKYEQVQQTLRHICDVNGTKPPATFNVGDFDNEVSDSELLQT